MIIYEYPLSESIRTMLRLEHLFKRLTLLMWREDPVDHHHALATIFEVMDVASRADLKTDLLRDLDRYKQQFMGYRGNPGHPEVQAAIEGAILRIQKAGKAAGILSADQKLAKRYIELGAAFVAVGVDTTVLMRGLQTLAATFKEGPVPTSSGGVY